MWEVRTVVRTTMQNTHADQEEHGLLVVFVRNEHVEAIIIGKTVRTMFLLFALGDDTDTGEF